MRFVNLQNADLRDSNFTNLIMTVSDLSNAKLQNVDFSGSQLTSSDLTGADLRHANLENTLCLGVGWAGAICPDGRLATMNEGCICGYDSFGPESPDPLDGWKNCHEKLDTYPLQNAE
jgi:hypothetical protein